MSEVIGESRSQDGKLCYLMFWCPGCEEHHYFVTKECDGNKMKKPWTWNSDKVSPTVHPSILVNKGNTRPDRPVCHMWVNNGRIRYLNDCTHKLKSKTVRMTPIDAV